MFLTWGSLVTNDWYSDPADDPLKSKVEHARRILRLLNFDGARSNERSALTLLALLGHHLDTPWIDSTNELMTTHAIMAWLRENYGKDYKPNTRETIRRQTLHQFVDATLIEHNPDDPTRPVNSPNNRYRVNPHALVLLRAYGGSLFEEMLKEYLREVPGQINVYARIRQLHRIPVVSPSGEVFSLSPGGQNDLIKQMVEVFCPQFTPGGKIFYVGDADSKWAIFEEEALADLGVGNIDQHGKMPDMVIYMPDRNWLILLEAVTSHGPVDGKRREELAALFADSTAGLVYVSCFPSRMEMRKYLTEIAWETEAWCADHPTHLIHFNGDRFLGPYESRDINGT